MERRLVCRWGLNYDVRIMHNEKYVCLPARAAGTGADTGRVSFRAGMPAREIEDVGRPASGLICRILVLSVCVAGSCKSPGPRSPDTAPTGDGASGAAAVESEQKISNERLAELLSTRRIESPVEERDEKGQVSVYAVILEMIAFLETHPNLSPYEQKQATDFLLEEQMEIYGCFVRDREMLLRLDPTSLYWRAAAGAAKFMTENFALFGEYDRRTQAKIYEYIYSSDVFVATLLPTFDGFAHGLSLFEQWKAGGQLIADENTPVSQEFVVCPRKIVVDKRRYPAERSVYGSACSNLWYRQMLGETAFRKRFAAYLTESGTPEMAETVALNLVGKDLDKVLSLFRGVETKPEVWKAAWRTMAEYAWTNTSNNADLLAASKRIWDMRPELRATVLWGLAQIDRNNNGYVDWKGLSSGFGTKVSKALFAEFLMQAPSSPSTVHLIWPTLTAGWSRADLLVPYLDRWLSDAQAGSIDISDAERSWKFTVDAMCREKGHSDLDKMKRYMESRIKEHPDEPFRPWLHYLDTRKCGRRASKKRAAGKEDDSAPALQIVQ